MRPPPHFSLFLLLHSLLLLAISANALPSGRRAVAGDFARRQEGMITQPITVETTQMSNTSLGPMVEDCIVKMTPITLDNGNSAVEMVRNCTLSLDRAGGNGTLPQSPPDTSSAGTSSDTSSPSSTYTLTPASPSNTTTTSAPITTDPPAPTTSPAQDPPPQDPAPTPDPATTIVQQGPVATSSTSTIVAGDLQSNDGGSFTIPGKKLSVLPIGLGVFAGLSVIALVIVGLVTYERTRYRKMFRQRKLAETLDFSSRT